MKEIQPYLIEGDTATGKPLHLIPHKHNSFNEQWLQDMLYKYPDILPLDQIEDAFTPAIPIGREIFNIDNLFISPAGLITIVETKLWRNPEAHRTVVAQILDYTKTLFKKSFNQLDEAVKAFMQKQYGKPKSIYETVKRMSQLSLKID
jgi:hypothetical protein